MSPLPGTVVARCPDLGHRLPLHHLEPMLSAASADSPARPNPPATLVFSAPEEPRPETRDAAVSRPVVVDPFAVPGDGTIRTSA